MEKRGAAWLIGGVVLVLAASALLLGLWPRGAGGVHLLFAHNDGAVIEVKVGERVTLELEGNPTTGYSWQITEIDPAVLAPSGEPDYQSSSDADGAGGVYTFRFDAVGAGETEVVLQYFPSWQEPSDTARVRSFTVRVG
ncbi:MAG: protease inhibitor I42 family protein [Actinobacteria bacterium]|nr:protease inhibitor I42 family protein [Actinomycetota bacterium]